MMKYITIAGEIFEGESSKEILLKMKRTHCGIMQARDESLDGFITYLSNYYHAVLNGRDYFDVLEQLQDLGFLLRIL